MHKTVSEIRIYPISSFNYPTEEYAKMCIANGFENYYSFYNLGNDRAYLNLYNSKRKCMSYYVTKYERNPIYREQAIKIHGLVCKTCGFDFEKTYGRLGEGYIEVHHKKPLFYWIVKLFLILQQI